jgi:uncharacterized protein YbbK (DUF523 family)
MKLVNACLVGINCNYVGENKLNQKLFEEFVKGNLYPVCPEVLGDLPVPRPPAEIKYGSGLDVLNNRVKVINPNGNDVSKNFIRGAYSVLQIAKAINAKEAILKSNSPSCGCGKIYDGTFSRNLVDGDGVTTALLKENGIKVFNENNFEGE